MDFKVRSFSCLDGVFVVGYDSNMIVKINPDQNKVSNISDHVL